MKAVKIGQALWFIGLKPGATVNKKLIPMTMILPQEEIDRENQKEKKKRSPQ